MLEYSNEMTDCHVKGVIFMTDFVKNPNPTKDQHFMVDKEMLQRIYDTANVQEFETICEIGGGEGALTDYLIQGNNDVTVIEKDPYYANYLKEKYKNNSNVIVIEGDALNFDYSSFDRIIANLPYTITEPFLINMAKSGALNYEKTNVNGTNIKSITLVLSQNSTRKMVAPVQVTDGKSKHQNLEYGLMGAICHAFVDVNIECAIPSESFYPEPAVTSFLVNLTLKKKKTTIDRIMSEFLMDKKGASPSIGHIYKLMLNQNKIYKVNKHKSNICSISTSCTSKVIENQNIYDLSNGQISTLVQDLINNDKKNKSNSSRNNISRYEDPLDRYLKTGEYDEDDETPVVYSKPKFEKNYDYLYDMRRFCVLLHRGLEYLPEETLKLYLNSNEIVDLDKPLDKDIGKSLNLSPKKVAML